MAAVRRGLRLGHRGGWLYRPPVLPSSGDAPIGLRASAKWSSFSCSRTLCARPSKVAGLTYCFGGVVYVSLTNTCNAGLTMFAANGPGFTFPAGTNFEPLPDDFEPTGVQAAEAAIRECQRLDAEEGVLEGGRHVVFAGLGEPLVRVEALLEALRVLKASPEVRDTRLNTNGLVPLSTATAVAESLQSVQLDHVCVQLQTAFAAQHAEMVKPNPGLDFDSACNFVSALAKAGFQVECTAVGHPDVDVEAVRILAISDLGAASFKVRPYFP
eukprot:gnl/TRDRNA2_/TRDRNA2_91706_c0_seq1.p1 gnl/TRDRNA2_/TRDRNA2_91706_c0~~gnl/TRDRNA2_/TRDRNA2_91706_c0_seq1.p1  ORF type:complete len:286 (+),score=35.16 gnl/TRDRNA2_/TRDRNA2_91706_c0_seq1:51-860(+)